MKLKIIYTITFLLSIVIVKAQNQYQWKEGASKGYKYRYVTNDPTKSRFYTLKNGLTVILSQNNKEPQITYKMAVRAGSSNDPRSNTGLAHYLEHLLFKGTDKFGTMDYNKEKPYLDKIENLYEVYNKTKDPQKRKEIYQQIDRVSGEASTYSIANEYDKIMKAIGSNVTNAHTSLEETVYEENLPSNAIDKFLAVQAERFRYPVFRIFHTELEAVYEEKNRSLDNDLSQLFEKMLFMLFPTHNYGQQTTLGTIEHLKNPSLVEIRKFYNRYYVPNNMALIMSGDINYDTVISKIDKAFAYMIPKPVQAYNPIPEKPLTAIQKVDIYGPSAENLYIAYRGYPQNSRESLLLELTANILSNGKAGLMDINLNKQQKVLKASAGYNQMKDYGMFILNSSPKAGQTLEAAQALLMEQVELLKKGQFDERLIPATVANYKLDNLQSFENNNSRAEAVLNSFILNRSALWNKTLSATDEMGKITKNELTQFANKFFRDNYVVMFKRKGESKNAVKVEKPAITAVKTNANAVSGFAKNVLSSSVQPLSPVFLDYKKDLSFGKAGIADVIAVKNNENGIFRMSYRFEMGSFNNKLLPYAVQYLAFLGTDRYSSEEISKAFYDIASNYNINVGPDLTTISISGLQENFDRAVDLLENVLSNCKADETSLNELKGRILKNRENAKLNKASILTGLMNYAQFGADNPFNYGLSDAEIKNIKAAELIDILHNLTNYQHTITYFGPKDIAEFKTNISRFHKLPKEFTPVSPIKVFKYAATNVNKVLFANYDMVQAEIRWVRNNGKFDPSDVAKATLYNKYFGGGMGSVVFQTIRESKALAYSTYAIYSSPNSPEKESSYIAYVGAQADKMNDAVVGMNELLDDIPEVAESFSISKGNTLSAIESGRITKDGIINSYLNDKKMGYDHDSRIDTYDNMAKLTFSDIKEFHRANASGKSFVYCVVGSDKKLSDNDLKKLGELHKISLEEIFGF